MNIKNFLVIFLSLFLISCIKDEVKLQDIFAGQDNEKKYEVVVEGFLTSELNTVKVKLSKPSGIHSLSFVPLNNAQVKLNTETQEFQFKESDNPGIYHSLEKIQGEIGTVYTLEITYDNKKYYAIDTLVKCSSNIDIPIKEIVIGAEHYEFYMSVHNFGFKESVVWNFTESADEYGQIISYNINELHNLNIYNHVNSMPQGLFPSAFTTTGLSGSSLDSLELIKMSASPAYYDYIISQFNVTDWSSGIFSVIPGNTKTNVSEGGTGFFFCTDVKRFRMTYEDLKKLVDKIHK